MRARNGCWYQPIGRGPWKIDPRGTVQADETVNCRLFPPVGY
jgi:hypothetical protein